VTVAEAAPNDKANSETTDQLRPYSPSWADRFTDLVKRLPGPNWLYYAGIALLLALIQAVTLWIEGIRPSGSFIAIHGTLTSMGVLFFALVHYLDDAAKRALKTLRPAMAPTVGDEQYQELEFRLTTLPALPTLLVCLAVVTGVVLTNLLTAPPETLREVANSAAATTVIYAMYLLTWWVVAAFVYHTIHQLQTINHIYTDHAQINVYRTSPLYALARVTAITAAGLAMPTYAWFAINPGLWKDPIGVAISLSITALALIVFVWPMLGIHRLLVEEKTHMQNEAALRFEAIVSELHKRVDSGNLDGMDTLNDAISSLEVERDALKKMPTWPWPPETVRLLITALALPLGLWLIQFFLQRAFAP
jgi:hypothetical protein